MTRYLTFIFVFNFYLLNAQLQTQTDSVEVSQEVFWLVKSSLLGDDASVSNIKYTGSPEAIGTFNASKTTLGIDQGIILTTGTVANEDAGPHGPNDQPNAGKDNSEPGYALLSNLIGEETHNAAVLEFDFVSNSDTVKFEYIFGSDEYPEFPSWIDGKYNDVVAFFISGPGIADTQNIALIPETDLEVAIKNVNNGENNDGPCVNCEHYVNNGTGDDEPFNSDHKYVQYDGLTNPLTAFYKIKPGETYHLIIAIADAGDAIFDSGVFLKTKSFTTSLNKHEKAKQIKLYPNPNHGSFVIENLVEEQIKNIEVFGVEGKKIAFDLEKTNNSVSKIKIRKPTPGVYWVKTIAKDGSFYSSKFVIDYI